MDIEQTLKLLVRMRINTLDAGSEERLNLEERYRGKEKHRPDFSALASRHRLGDLYAELERLSQP